MAKKDNELKAYLQELIKKIAGKSAEPIIDVLYGKKNVNEFKIANTLKLTINQVRNILYRISSFTILESTRKKDKRKGWYTYFWTLNNFKALETLEKIKEKEIENLEHLLQTRQIRRFYECKTCNKELLEEAAMHHNFFCPECDQLLQPTSEDKKIKEIINKIENSKKEINNIRKLIEEMRSKVKPKEKKKKVKKKFKTKAKKIKKKKVKKRKKKNKRKKKR